MVSKRRSSRRVWKEIFCLIIVTVLYSLQQFLLIRALLLKIRHLLVLLWLIWDVSLALYIIWSIFLNDNLGSIRCAVQWLLYTFTVATKIAIFSFVAKHGDRDIIYIFSNFFYVDFDASIFVATMGFFITPVLHIFFVWWAKCTMYVRKSQIVSIEGLLHADLCLTVTLDLLDVSIMYKAALHVKNRAVYDLVQWDEELIAIITIIIILTGFVLLGFAFSTSSKATHCMNNGEDTDLFVSVKHAFLIGLFLIDIPYLACRIYWSYKYKDYSWFLIKNVFFLLFRPFRLNQCRLAERERAKGTQKSFFYDTEARHLLIDNEGNIEKEDNVDEKISEMKKSEEKGCKESLDEVCLMEEEKKRKEKEMCGMQSISGGIVSGGCGSTTIIKEKEKKKKKIKMIKNL